MANGQPHKQRTRTLAVFKTNNPPRGHSSHEFANTSVCANAATSALHDMCQRKNKRNKTTQEKTNYKDRTTKNKNEGDRNAAPNEPCWLAQKREQILPPQGCACTIRRQTQKQNDGARGRATSAQRKHNVQTPSRQRVRSNHGIAIPSSCGGRQARSVGTV